MFKILLALGLALVLALSALNVVPVISAIRLDHDVQQEWNYCVNVTDRAFPWYCDPAAVRLNVEDRPGTW